MTLVCSFTPSRRVSPESRATRVFCLVSSFLRKLQTTFCGSELRMTKIANFVSVKSSQWLGQVGDWPSQSHVSWRGTWTASKAVALYAWQGRTTRWATNVTQRRHATPDKCFACWSQHDTNASGKSVSSSSIIISWNLGQIPTLSESKKHIGLWAPLWNQTWATDTTQHFCCQLIPENFLRDVETHKMLNNFSSAL